MHRKHRHRIILIARKVVVVTMIVCFPALRVAADLGDRLQNAEAREPAYRERYGAVAPIFDTNEEGLVVMECWAAPPDMWQRDQALEFATQLLPERLSSVEPIGLPLDGTEEVFRYSDGTEVVLRRFNNLYFGVEVRAPGYEGPRC